MEKLTAGPFGWNKICRTPDDDNIWCPQSPCDGNPCVTMEEGVYFITTKSRLASNRTMEIRRNILLNNSGFWNRLDVAMQPPIVGGGNGYDYLLFSENGKFDSYRRLEMGECHHCSAHASQDLISDPTPCANHISLRNAEETALGGRILKIGKAMGGGVGRRGINRRLHGYRRMQYAVTRYALGCRSAIHAELEFSYIETKGFNDALSGSGISVTTTELETDLQAAYLRYAGYLPPWEQYHRYASRRIPPERSRNNYSELLNVILDEAGMRD